MASTIKVDNVQNQPGTNIIDKCGTTITLGQSGDTVTLASGASQSGFGREGSVDWQTGSIKTGTFTAVSGEGYFVNTSGGTSTANLPAGSAGAIVAFSDYTRTFNSNNLTISPNGSEKIGGQAEDATLTVDGQSATFVYVDSTEGWINVQETQTSQTGNPPYLTATGGSIATVGDYKIHTFTGPGTFCVSVAGSACGNNKMDYLVVAGGGSGGMVGPIPAPGRTGGGGGAGGFRESRNPASAPVWAASPLVTTCSLTASVQAYPITVGAGGAAAPYPQPICTHGNPGANSIFSTITSAGGGGGGMGISVSPLTPYKAPSGGSGGGGGASEVSGQTLPGGCGNTPSVVPPQGSNGGNTTYPHGGWNAAGGGGATAVGGNTGPGCSSEGGGDGGAGATTTISNTPTAYAGGGGGAGYGGPPTTGQGGTGGGGDGTRGSPAPGPAEGQAGTANTGGGGGGGNTGSSYPGGGYAGGSGIVIIRYKFQN